MKLVVDETEHIVKGVVLLFKVYEGGGGKAQRAKLVCSEYLGSRQAFCVFRRIGMEQSAVDDTEDGCSRADAKGEDGDSCEG
jgi:hypothetical protein